MKKIILAILLLSGIQAHAGNDGGGGGGFCFDSGKCITLAEAGFRIEEVRDNQDPVINTEILQELDVLLDSLPLDRVYKLQIKRLVLATSITYKKVISYDSSVLKEIRSEYEKILNKEGLSSDNLVIYGLSNKKNTYLFPEYQKLNLRSKVLILIHEGIVRWTGSVVSALKFDGAILDLLSGESRQIEIDEVLQRYNPVTDWTDKTTLLFAYVEEYNRKNKSYLNLQNLVPSSVSSRIIWSYCSTAEDEINLYRNHNLLLQIMRKYKINCFSSNGFKMIAPFKYHEHTGEVQAAKAEGSRVCKDIGSGSVVTSIDINKYSYPDSTYVITPSKLIVFECAKQKIVSVYSLKLE